MTDTQIFTHVVQVCVPYSVSDDVDPRPVLIKTLENTQKLDKTAHLLPGPDIPGKPPIMHPSKVPKGEDCEAYATDLQADSKRKQFVYYITIKTALSFVQFKQGNVHQMAFLKKHRIWMTRHSLTSRQVTGAAV
jgi:hypothetical protein